MKIVVYYTRHAVKIPRDTLPLPRKTELQQSLRLTCEQIADFSPREILVDFRPDILIDFL